jgi:hypothetical protein
MSEPSDLRFVDPSVEISFFRNHRAVVDRLIAACQGSLRHCPLLSISGPGPRQGTRHALSV